MNETASSMEGAVPQPADPVVALPATPVLPRQKNYLYLGIVILIFLVTLAAGVFFFIKSQALKKELTTLTTLAAPSPIASMNPTANWLTYTNEDHGYSLKYPGVFSIDKEFNDENNKAAIFKNGNSHFEVMLRQTPANFDFEEYFYMDTHYQLKETLGGNVAQVYELTQGYCDGPSCGAPSLSYVTTKDDYLYHLNFYGDTVLSDEEKLILSTFQFNN